MPVQWTKTHTAPNRRGHSFGYAIGALKICLWAFFTGCLTTNEAQHVSISMEASDAIVPLAPFDFLVSTEGTVDLMGDVNALWQQVNGSQDPFDELRESTTSCQSIAYRSEYNGIEFDTGRCNHITLKRESPVPIPLHSTIRISGWHSTLASADLGAVKGEIVLRFGDEDVWSYQSAIPAPARSFDQTFTTPLELDANQNIYLHVRNHGANTWNVLRLELEINQ